MPEKKESEGLLDNMMVQSNGSFLDTEHSKCNGDSFLDMELSKSYSGTHGSVDVLKIPLSEEPPKNCCQRPYVIEPAAFLYGLAFAISLTSSDQYIYERVESTSDLPSWAFDVDLSNHSRIYAVEEEYKADATLICSQLTLTRDVPSVIMTLIINNYTDYVGRKFGLILPAIGGILRICVYLIVNYLNLSVYYLFIGAFIEGCMGYHMAFIGCMFAYVSDCTKSKNRSFRFVVANSAFYLSGAVSFFSSGFIIEVWGYSGAFWSVFVCLLACLLHLVFLLPEPPRQEKTQSFSIINCFKKTIEAFKVFFKPRHTENTRRILLLGILVSFLFAISFEGQLALSTLYLIGPPYNFSSTQVGFFLGLTNLFSFLLPILSLVLLSHCMPELAIAVLSCVLGVAGYLMEGLAANTVQLYIAVILQNTGPSITPVSRAIMSKLVEPHEQGAVQACIGALYGLAELFSGTLLVAIYGATLAILNGLVYILLSFCLVICAGIFGYMWHLQRTDEIIA